MIGDRHLDWDGCYNARDLGGLATSDGRRTRWGGVVRSDSVDRLTARGWSALVEHGVRTIIDLREDDERAPATWDRPAEVTTVHLPLDDTADTALWTYIWDNELDGGPVYYRVFLERKHARCAAVIAAVARAPAGGVLVHCGIGRDRTGLIALLILALAGVRHEEIAADYAASAERLPALLAALGLPGPGRSGGDERPGPEDSGSAAVLALLGGMDIASWLSAGGLTPGDVLALRARLLEAG